MAVVIRLQGLRKNAGSEDIRNFFTGLKIPDGAVHIIGGPLEEAFIIFASDDHARRAMARSGGCIKGFPVFLFLSSKAEMQNVLEANTKRTEMSKSRVSNDGFRRAETNMPPSLLQLRIMKPLEMNGISGPAFREDVPVQETRKSMAGVTEDLYLHLQGLPFSITQEDVRAFFQGLPVEGIILMKNWHGQHNGMGIVKFATTRDTYEGLKRDRGYIGNRFIELSLCAENQWIEAGGSVGPDVDNTTEFLRESPPPNEEKGYPLQRSRSISPFGYRSRSSSPSDNEYCILIENLSYSVEKRDLKKLFRPVELQDDQILHLIGKNGNRTRAAFVLFRSLKDYCHGLTRHKENFSNRTIYVSPISKEKMVAMLESPEPKVEKDHEKPSTSLDRSQRSPRPKNESERICVYVRNLPFDVHKVEVMDFFQGIGLSEMVVHLLFGKKGAALGEALVTFNSEEEAQMAESLNGQLLLGSEVMVKCISRMQMKEFGVMGHPKKGVDLSLRIKGPEEYSARHREASNFPLDGEYPDIEIPSDVHVPLSNLPVRSHGCSSRFDSRKDGRDEFVDRDGGSAQRGLDNQFDGPACLQLMNLPLKITIEEIYDFCYGYRVIPGSVSLQYNKDGSPRGCASVVFESHQEAQTAIQELSGRPIGAKRIKLVFL